MYAETEADADTATEDTNDLLNQTPVFNEGNVDATAVMLIDAKTGLVMYAKNEAQTIYPASTTKMMTCLIVLGAIRNERHGYMRTGSYFF